MKLSKTTKIVALVCVLGELPIIAGGFYMNYAAGLIFLGAAIIFDALSVAFYFIQERRDAAYQEMKRSIDERHGRIQRELDEARQ